MFRKALMGFWVSCVCATLSTAPTFAATTDIVLYSSDATNLRGNWSLGTDASAAGGQVLTSTDKGWSNTTAAQASPADSVDFVFSAPAGTAYRVWMRMRAAGNSKYNDSVFAQFSDAVDANGGPLFAIGTANSLTVNLASDGTGSSLNGWGWQGGAYWLTQSATIRFAANGTHTLRIQTREDGVQIDQAVLSAVTYLTTPPGPVTSDTTIVPKPVATLPAPWATQAVGANTMAGNASYTTGTYSVAGSGADIWGTGDSFQLLSQPAVGDMEIVVRVLSLQNTNTYAKAGVMLRDSTAAGSAHVLLDVRPNGSIEFMSRSATDATTTYIAGGTQAMPAWLKLTRTGTMVTGSVSSNGTVWTRIGTASSTTTGDIGLAVTSHSVAKLTTAVFDNVMVGAPAATITPPSAPTVLAPANGATGVALTSTLSWSSTGATSYDINFGTANPPPSAAAGRTSATFTPAAMAAGTKYFWQVTARNSSGATAGPVWTVTTMIAPPSAPVALAPVNGATGVAVTSTLTWSSSNATSYDVAFGTTTPPPSAAVGLPNGSYTPPTMTAGTTYYWRVIARNAGGTTAGVVSSFVTTASVPTPPPGPETSPTAYTAISDRNAYAKPPVPRLGAAGFKFNDPTFGSPMMRVTDGGTRPGSTNRSYRVPSNAHLAAWNATSTAFFVISNDGTVLPYAFDAATVTASRVQPGAAGDGGLTLGFYVEPQFSLVNPNVIYGVANGGNNLTVKQYDFTSGGYSTILDLDTIIGGLSGTYVGGMMTGGHTPENLIVFFGGQSQDAHYYALWAPINNIAARKVLDTVNSTINGGGTGTALNFHLHSVQIDKSGRFVFLYPTGGDLGAPRYAAQVYVWDTQTDGITPITAGRNGSADMHPGGHDAAGYGNWLNQDCCTSSTWDAMQWQFRDLTNPAATSDLISPVLLPKEIYIDDHTTWNNARPDALVPVISSTFRYGGNTAPWRAWDDEIIAIDTTGGIGAFVWRFAHHRSNSASDTDPLTPYFWYEPIANVSPDGRWVLFTSNWEKTLGTDSAEGTFRQDVFLVQLTPR